MRCVPWVALLLVGQWGCQCRSQGDHTKAKSSASASPGLSSSAPAEPSAEPPAVPQEHRISVVAVPRPGSDTRDIVARVSGPPLELKLAEVEASRRCGLATVYRIERPGLPPSPGRGVMLTCDADASIPIIVEGNRLRLGETFHELGPGPIIHPEEVEGYEAVDCPSWKQKKRPLREIHLERREVTAPDPEAGRAYSLGAIVDGEFLELGRLPKTAMSCSSSRVSVNSYMKVICEFGERGISLLLKVDQDVFWSEWWDKNYVGSERRARFGWEVGCQHQPVFRRFFVRDPGYKRLIPGCAEICRQTREECMNFCYRTATDDRGILWHSSAACADCDEEEQKCVARCPDAAP